MISFVRGILEEIQDGRAVVDTGGIGYAVNVSEGTAARLPRRGEAVTLYTHLNMREDGAELFGFLAREDLAMFKRLITVSGIGPRVAQGVLSVMDPAQITLAIIAEDTAALARAPGVGKKTAGRMVLELKDSLRTSDAFVQGAASTGYNPNRSDLPAGANSKREAADALCALGYSRSEAVSAVLSVDADSSGGLTAEQIIKLALRKLSRL